jgi:hypothetical protein
MMRMKVSEALSERADLIRAMSAVKARAVAAARYTEGEEPSETAAALLDQHGEMAGRLESLVRRINETNLSTTLPNGMTVTAAIAHRDVLSLRRKALTEVTDAAEPGAADRYGFGQRRRAELATLTALDVKARRRDADRLAAEHRTLDHSIQEANFGTELGD